jgi:hypothetical protein
MPVNPDEVRLKALQEQYEERAIWAGALASARNTPEMDQFAGWTLGITGAALALLLGNLDKVVPFTGTLGLVAAMLLMLLSAYFGFVARFQAYQVKIHLNLHADENLEIRKAYEADGGGFPLRMDKVEATVLKIAASPEIEEMSAFGKFVWRITGWFIALPAPKPNLEGLEPEYQGIKETVFRAGAVLRCVVWQMSALFAAVITAAVGILIHWARST